MIILARLFSTGHQFLPFKAKNRNNWLLMIDSFDEADHQKLLSKANQAVAMF